PSLCATLFPYTTLFRSRRLPDRYRSAILLCDLGDRTRKEAAQQFGVPEGTLSGWLSRGRAMLARRLARRGVTIAGGALATLLAQKAASASVPAAVLTKTVQTPTLLAAGGAANGVLSSRVAALASAVVRAMLLAK